MVIKIISLFLVAMVALAIFGRFRFPRPGAGKREKFCPGCGRPRIGKGPCPCGHKG